MTHRNVEIEGQTGPQTFYREQFVLLVQPDDRDIVLIQAEAPSAGGLS